MVPRGPGKKNKARRNWETEVFPSLSQKGYKPPNSAIKRPIKISGEAKEEKDEKAGKAKHRIQKKDTSRLVGPSGRHQSRAIKREGGKTGKGPPLLQAFKR